jgi:hypothetical protein
MSKVQIETNNDSRKWIVEFTDLRVQNDHQRRVAESLDRGTLFSILKMFLRVATPGAQVLEQHGTAAMKIMFPSRAASRKFRSSLGGRLLSAGI